MKDNHTNDRVPPKKQANIRHAAACLAAITSEANRATARSFLDWKVQHDQRSTSSVTFYAQISRDLDHVLGGRPYASTDHLDGAAYVAKRGASMAPDSLVNELTRVKHFLKWVLRDAGAFDLQKLPYRLETALTIRRKSNRHVKKERPLEDWEFQALLEAAKDEPDSQALYWMCWDSDVRIGEALVLNWDDYVFQSDGGAIIEAPAVDGFTKTGERSPYVYQSVAAMRVWQESHQMDALPGTAIFTTKTRPFRRASYHAVRGRLVRHLANAGIRANVHFHLFRKTGATRRARTMDPDEFRAYHGWTAGSRVATQYIMDSNEQARKSIRKEAGLSDDGATLERVAAGMKLCTFCAESIKKAALKCRHCGELVSSSGAPTVGRWQSGR